MPDETQPPVYRMSELPREPREFLAQLTQDDIDTFKTGLPIIRAMVGFGKVAKWLLITVVGLFLGLVMLWESALKVLGWLWPPPPH